MARNRNRFTTRYTEESILRLEIPVDSARGRFLPGTALRPLRRRSIDQNPF